MTDQTPIPTSHAKNAAMTNAPAGNDAAGAGGGGGDALPFRYSAKLARQIEEAWRGKWEREGTFITPNPGQPGFDASRPKKYILDMFPYPSGSGLHVGHPLGYIATDIYARFMRMTGHNVIHAMGFDAFGLPAEQFAVQNNIHPRKAVEQNIGTMRAQLKRLGLAHDPTRSVSTTDEEFYRWTQWIFLRIYNSWYDTTADGGAGGKGKARPIAELVEQFERGERTTPDGRPWSKMDDAARRAAIDAHRLAFLAEVPVNWCPMLGTVLANEEVTADGRSERGNYPVYKRPLKQWMMRITAYADRLLNDLEIVEWPEKVKLMQRNWIGRSEGALADFACSTRRIRVFTTRPDTMFGATYVTLSPDHEMVDQIAPEKYGSASFTRAIFPGADAMIARNATPAEMIAEYRRYAAAKAKRQSSPGEDAEKTGVFIGAYAINPVNGQRVPVFIADYVLTGYGTGAIMAVPAHDERDMAFAKAFGLPIRDVVYPRQVVAMAYYASHAASSGGDGAEPAQWREELADFLGVVTSEGHTHAPLEQVLREVRQRRSAGNAVVTTSDASAPGGVGERRGVTREVWLETLDDLDIRSFDELKRRFDAAGYYAAEGEAYTGPGFSVNSAGPALSIDGLETAAAKAKVTEHLAAAGLGKPSVNYKLRDWLFSRQRYWGEPFPIVFDEAGVPHALPETMLPVTLPQLENFQPESSEDPDAPVRTPLDRAAAWRDVTLDLGDGPKAYRRETNTMPNWAGSCWYYLRYLDPKNDTALVDKQVEKYWMAGLGGEALRADSSLDNLLSCERVIAEGFTGHNPYPDGIVGLAEHVTTWAGRLPHYEIEGATYFVTWRCRDGVRLSESQRDEAMRALLHFDNERCRVYAAVVMPDHVHWIVRPLGGHRLHDLIASVKKYISTHAKGASESTGKNGLWQGEHFDHIVRDATWLTQFLRYVVENPVKDGLANSPSRYRWVFVHETVRSRDGESCSGGWQTEKQRRVGTECLPTRSGGVDLYVGGVEHAVLHLLYARFWHKVLFDLGAVSTPEPFARLFNQGYIQAHAYKDDREFYVPANEVVNETGELAYMNGNVGKAFSYQGRPVKQEYGKMGKSLKNSVAPDAVCEEFGCDTLRLYEMSMGPLDADKPWSTRDIPGAYRFLQRVWRNIVDEQTGAARVSGEAAPMEMRRALHKTIKGVRQDMTNLQFNTAITKLIEFNNLLTKHTGAGGAGSAAATNPTPREVAEAVVKMLSPLAPHAAAEMWQRMGGAGELMHAPFPTHDEALCVDDQIEIPVQIQGKVRARIMVAAGADAKTVEAAALADEKVKAGTEGKPVKKVIVVPGKLVNIVV